MSKDAVWDYFSKIDSAATKAQLVQRCIITHAYLIGLNLVFGKFRFIFRFRFWPKV